MSESKPFSISKKVVYEAYLKVKANRGAAGVDGESIEEFERDLKGNLYKLWNRLSSGTYFPPPVRAVEIPKPEGRGKRVLGVPTVADRIAQTAAKMYLEPEVEPLFHPSSYGYRPGRSALDAVGACREQCWSMDWVIDLDIAKLFDTIPHSLVLRAVVLAITEIPHFRSSKFPSLRSWLGGWVKSSTWLWAAPPWGANQTLRRARRNGDQVHLGVTRAIEFAPAPHHHRYLLSQESARLGLGHALGLQPATQHF